MHNPALSQPRATVARVVHRHNVPGRDVLPLLVGQKAERAADADLMSQVVSQMTPVRGAM